MRQFLPHGPLAGSRFKSSVRQGGFEPRLRPPDSPQAPRPHDMAPPSRQRASPPPRTPLPSPHQSPASHRGDGSTSHRTGMSPSHFNSYGSAIGRSASRNRNASSAPPATAPPSSKRARAATFSFASAIPPANGPSPARQSAPGPAPQAACPARLRRRVYGGNVAASLGNRGLHRIRQHRQHPRLQRRAPLRQTAGQHLPPAKQPHAQRPRLASQLAKAPPAPSPRNNAKSVASGTWPGGGSTPR